VLNYLWTISWHIGEWRCNSTFLYFGSRWRWVVSFTPLPLYPQEEVPGIHSIGDSVGPRAGLDTVERRKSCTVGNQTRIVQLLARRYTDWAIQTLTFMDMTINYHVHKDLQLIPNVRNMNPVYIVTSYLMIHFHNMAAYMTTYKKRFFSFKHSYENSMGVFLKLLYVCSHYLFTLPLSLATYKEIGFKFFIKFNRIDLFEIDFLNWILICNFILVKECQ
jgi:hypothetical protein